MSRDAFLLRQIGDEPPLLADGRKPPDRREVSLRWLSGTFMTAVTSSLLMGVALFGALEGREQLALPAEALASTDMDGRDAPSKVEKGSRLFQSVVASKVTDREIMEVSTMVRDGDRDVVRKQPFAHVRMQLAAAKAPTKSYPKFDPLKIFASEDTDTAPVHTGQIYGADVDSEISLRTVDFPLSAAGRPFAASMTLAEAEETVRTNGSVLTDGTVQLASLYYVDPRRFASAAGEFDFAIGQYANVRTENVSVAPMEPDFIHQTPEFVDDIIPIRKATAVGEALLNAGYDELQFATARDALAKMRGGDGEMPDMSVLRVGVVQTGAKTEVVRLSAYENGRHVATVGRNDDGFFIRGMEPPETPAIETAFEQTPAIVPAGRPQVSVYDGIYRAGLEYDMPVDMLGQVIHLLASNVDFKAQLHPTDTMEAFFSVADDDGTANEDSELLFLNASFGSTKVRLYRFQDPKDGSVDYYDQDGRSAKNFLIRNPVPNGRFTSGFGMRRHPILGYSRMHTGTDWAAPRGTPIIATGNGTVIKASWDSGGYGRQTLIKHANGYVSSYNHQSKIADGVVPGAKVRQGQVIGYVGSTGLSTGPHLHYELIVNGKKVDAMRVRLPEGKALEGQALASFTRERDRINALLDIKLDDTEVASR
ncbi:MAG: peptidase M24 [Hoeflea sp.]|nr:peptidase M24 [Hoeflea sp.]|tara:strand:- start:1372 stop:3321 length:1950 start_codon:yes stop_codon:yes gene_type:complete